MGDWFTARYVDGPAFREWVLRRLGNRNAEQILGPSLVRRLGAARFGSLEIWTADRICVALDEPLSLLPAELLRDEPSAPIAAPTLVSPAVAPELAERIDRLGTGEPQRVAALARQAGADPSRNTAYRAMARLVAEGRWERCEDGSYRRLEQPIAA